MATFQGGKTPQPDPPRNLNAQRAGSGSRPSDPPKRPKKITVPWVRSRGSAAGEPLVMVTAYDYPQARTVDDAAELVLVGDSVAMVVLGHRDTLSLTLDEMLHHVKAVRRGMDRALLVADMPYGSFHLGPQQAVANALRLVKEGGAEAVKIEGARTDVVAALAAAEIPVMGHLGLTPQSLHAFGGFKVQGRGDQAADALLEAARAMEDAGCFSLVLECIPEALAGEVTAALSIPTIGIGAGPHCNGQVLVYHDLLGLEDRLAPRFVRRYSHQGADARDAVARFAADVRSRAFPSKEESFADPSRSEPAQRAVSNGDAVVAEPATDGLGKIYG